MQKTVQNACFRLFHKTSFLIVLLALAGCQTTDLAGIGSDLFSGSSSSQTSTQKSTSTATQTSQPKLAKSKVPWGVLSFTVDPNGPTPDYWNIYVTGSTDSPNFKPYSGTMLMPGHRHVAQLWPGTYQVRIEHGGAILFEGPVTVDAGSLALLDAKYGYFKNTVEQASQTLFVEMLPPANKTVRIDMLYAPIVIQRGNGWQLEYRGQQSRGEIRTDGKGIVGIRKNGEEIVKITKAEITPTEISGTFILNDGGETPGAIDRETMDFKPEDITRWITGKTFEGTYEAGVPLSGTLKFADGTQWEGWMKGGDPDRSGRLTEKDGSWLEVENYNELSDLTGMIPCGTAPNDAKECAYFHGKEIASKAELEGLLAEEKRLAEIERQRLEKKRLEELAAAQALAEARELAAAQQAANDAAAAAQKRDDCTTATGTFTADNGLTSYNMNGSGSGSGHFRQRTYGSEYQFDIDFRFTTSANRISFDYGEGVYSDAGSGAVLQRTAIPNGSANCSFNGRVLTIDGKEFVKR
ncbi:hypothetical protein [Thalassospira sp.]|uniref:hypothetical protein n=1 Tax=Thalassospira sp. TaxID=1912094 RepID=UPI0025EBE40D|nr:hypothetical protein [Thalassospira sp.]